MSPGFTTIEILVALALSTILFAAGALSFTGLRDVGALRREVSVLINTIHRGTTAAALGQRELRLTLNSRGYQYTDAAESTYHHTFPKLLSIGGITPGANRSITFFPSGVVTPTTITLHSPSRICTLRLSLRGRVSSECT